MTIIDNRKKHIFFYFPFETFLEQVQPDSTPFFSPVCSLPSPFNINLPKAVSMPT